MDNSVYTGITTDTARRFHQHCSGRGAKYTRSHKPQKIIAVFESADKSTASQLEYRIKHLSKSQKEFIAVHKSLAVLQDKLDITKYTYIEGETIGNYS